MYIKPTLLSEDITSTYQHLPTYFERRAIFIFMLVHLPARPKRATDDSLVILGDMLDTKVNSANVTAPAKFVIRARNTAA